MNGEVVSKVVQLGIQAETKVGFHDMVSFRPVTVMTSC